MNNKNSQDKLVNVCGEKIYFWIEGNTSEAFTKIDEHFNYLEKNAYKAKRLLTYTQWRKYQQELGYAEFRYGKEYYERLKVAPDGTILEVPNKYRQQYRDAKLIPLNAEEMQYIRSKVLVSPNADNIEEFRWFLKCENRIWTSIQVLCLDTKTNKLIEHHIDHFLPEENVFEVDLRWAGPDVVFSNKVRPLTQEEMKGIKAKAKQQDEQAAQISQERGIELPKLPTEYAKLAREEYLNNGEGENE